MLRSGLRKLFKFSLFSIYLLALSSLLLFAAFELFPALLDRVNLQSIKYYALKTEYVPDPALVFVYRRKIDRTLSGSAYPDLYSPKYGVEVPQIKGEASYNEHGFRRSGATTPYDVAVVGDSFIEVGETDASTLSEQLRAETGMSTLNLGRAWYGPDQYLEVLKRYGLAAKPKYALFCFYDGNDIRDMQQYKKWKDGGGYYFYYDAAQRGFFRRYFTALSDTRVFLTNSLRARLARPESQAQAQTIHPDLAVVRVGAEKVVMNFAQWDDSDMTKERLLASGDWQDLKGRLAEFRRLCLEHGITPVVVYIPTKTQVYGRYHTPESGERVLSQMGRQLAVESVPSQTLDQLTQELQLRYVNLLPYFQQQVGQGKLLYYPFDTHWAAEGRRAAATHIADALHWPTAQQVSK